MYKASLEKHVLEFKQASGTSRGVLIEKDSWFIRIWKESLPEFVGIGEASIIKGLSPDWGDNYEAYLQEVVDSINDFIDEGIEKLVKYPSIYFAVEMALIDLKNGGNKIYFTSDFIFKRAPIKINGLVWMGSKDFMLTQIKEKIADGFDCIKLKIGALDFEKELELIQFIRSKYSASEIELRVDANGAFSTADALDKLNQLAAFEIHSIEQPIQQNQWPHMKKLCATTPLPIALDEELIGIIDFDKKKNLLETIMPQYIILKPSLIGGFKGTDEWIRLAENLGIQWWITSALESNIGLNAIAQYTFRKKNPLPQGLGTGQLYKNNIKSALKIENGNLYFG